MYIGKCLTQSLYAKTQRPYVPQLLNIFDTRLGLLHIYVPGSFKPVIHDKIAHNWEALW